MRRVYKAFLTVMLVLWDVLSVIISILLGLRLRYGFGRDLPGFYIRYFWIIIFICCGLAVLLNILFRCYSGILKYMGIPEVSRQVFSVITFCIILIVANIIWNLVVNNEVIIIVSAFLILLMLLGRSSVCVLFFLRTKILMRINNRGMEKVVIYGAGEAGKYLQKQLIEHFENKMRPVAFIDDDKALHGAKINGIKVYGGKENLVKIIKETGAKKLIVAIPSAPKEFIKDIVYSCKQYNCAVSRFGSINDVDDKVENLKISDIDLSDLLRRDSVKLNMEAVMKFIEGKTVLVTGGVGSIGSEICRQVLKFNAAKLIIFDINENGLFEIDNELKKKFDESGYEVVLGSVRDRGRLCEVFEKYKPEIVFHAAAHKHVPLMEGNPKEAIKNNVFGTINVAETAIKYKAEKFILISTDKAVNPTNIMGASKRIAELVIQIFDSLSDTDFAAVRFGNVLGSNGSVVPFFQKQIEEGGPVTVTHREMKRYFMTIPEAVQLVLEAGAMAQGGEIFVLDMGEPVYIYDMACDLIKLNGYVPEKDIKIVITGLRPGEKLFEEISLADEDTTKTTNNMIFICKPIEHDVDFITKTIKDLEIQIHDNGVDNVFASVKKLVSTFNHNMYVD